MAGRFFMSDYFPALGFSWISIKTPFGRYQEWASTHHMLPVEDAGERQKNQSGGGPRKLIYEPGDSGGILDFPPSCGPAHHPCTWTRFPWVFLSPRPPLSSKITVF